MAGIVEGQNSMTGSTPNVTPTRFEPLTDDLLEVVTERIVDALTPEQVILFGSHMEGRATADSDVDLLVEFSAQQKTFDNFMQTSFLLEELLQRPVELVTTQALSPYIGPRILGEVEHDLLTA